MKFYGIIGRPIGHSASPEFYNARFKEAGIDARYDFLELPVIEALKPLLPTLSGFNVTAPYKMSAMHYLDDFDPIARKIGAVNCVVRENGKLVGYNTDYYGFKVSLLDFIGEERHKTLIFGTGGVARVVAFVLNELGIAYKMVSRSKNHTNTITYSDLTPLMISEHKLLINATPLGMLPCTDSIPDIEYEAITSEHYLYDLVYNPPLTRFLEKGKRCCAHIKNGSEMWRIQAEKALELFVSG